MLSKVRDTLTLWKVKITRASGYLSIINTFMLLYLFTQQIYQLPLIKGHFSGKTFFLLVYLVAFVGFLILAELDWRFVYLRESGFHTSKQPAMITECFRSAYLLYKAKEEGKDIASAFEKLRLAFRLTGYEREFLEFWRMLEESDMYGQEKSDSTS